MTICKSPGVLPEFLCVIHDKYIVRTFRLVYMTGPTYLLQSNFLPRSNFDLHFKMRNKPLYVRCVHLAFLIALANKMHNISHENIQKKLIRNTLSPLALCYFS